MNLVVMQNRTAVTSSLVVAESFEKEHKHVLRDIEKLKNSLSKLGLTPKDLFFDSEYVNENNKQVYKMYYMNRDGFTMLVGNFTGEKAMLFRYQYTQAFNEMEKRLLEMNRPSYEIDNPVERALKWAEEQKEKMLLEEKIEEQKPKVLFAEAITASTDSILLKDFVTLLTQNGINTGEKRLFNWMKENKYLKKSGRFNIPTQKSNDKKLFELLERPVFKNGKEKSISLTPKLTAEGQKYFINKFLKIKADSDIIVVR